MPNQWIPSYDTEESLNAWQQRVKEIMPMIRRTKAFQDVVRDYNTEMQSGSPDAINAVTQVMLELAVDMAYRIGVTATVERKQEICVESA